jgi:hypothetical protein
VVEAARLTFVSDVAQEQLVKLQTLYIVGGNASRDILGQWAVRLCTDDPYYNSRKITIPIIL